MSWRVWGRCGVRIDRAALGLAILVLGVAPASAQDEAQKAREAIEQLQAGIQAILAHPQSSPDQKRALFERALRSRLDYGLMTAKTLGSLKQRFSQEQYADFAHEYARFLTDALARRVASFDEPFELVDARWNPETGRARVTTRGPTDERAVGSGFDSGELPSTEYTLASSRGSWRVTGIRLSGVQVSENFHAQFEALLSRSDPDALIAELQRRNDKAEDDNPFAN